MLWPRTMPEIGAQSISFECSQVDYMSPETGGRVGAIAAGFPLWRMRLSLANLTEADADIWRAFVATLRGPRRQFIARDITRDKPRRMGTFSPVATAWTQTITADGDASLALEGLLAGMVLTLGDYIGFRWDSAGADPGTFDRRALVRVVESGSADATGDLTVIVEPPVPTIVPSDAEAYFYQPSCLMRLVPGSAQLGEQVLGGYTAQGGVIEAVQELLA